MTLGISAPVLLTYLRHRGRKSSKSLLHMMEVGGVALRGSTSCLASSGRGWRWRSPSWLAFLASARRANPSTPPTFSDAKTTLSSGFRRNGGGGSRTPVPERVPRASTGLSDHLSCREGGSGSTRLPFRIPVVVHRPLRAEACASLGCLRALRPLKAARPRTRRYRRLRGESEIAVVVGN